MKTLNPPPEPTAARPSAFGGRGRFAASRLRQRSVSGGCSSAPRRPMKHVSLFFTAAIVFTLASHADETPKPITYHLQTAQYADTFGKAPEYVFVVGGVAYRSLQDLQKAISHFPKGSTLRWAPSCRGPLGLSEKQEEELKAFCDSCGIKFVHVPSG